MSVIIIHDVNPPAPPNTPTHTYFSELCTRRMKTLIDARPNVIFSGCNILMMPLSFVFVMLLQKLVMCMSDSGVAVRNIRATKW